MGEAVGTGNSYTLLVREYVGRAFGRHAGIVLESGARASPQSRSLVDPSEGLTFTHNRAHAVRTVRAPPAGNHPAITVKRMVL